MNRRDGFGFQRTRPDPDPDPEPDDAEVIVLVARHAALPRRLFNPSWSDGLTHFERAHVLLAIANSHPALHDAMAAAMQGRTRVLPFMQQPPTTTEESKP